MENMNTKLSVYKNKTEETSPRSLLDCTQVHPLFICHLPQQNSQTNTT